MPGRGTPCRRWQGCVVRTGAAQRLCRVVRNVAAQRLRPSKQAASVVPLTNVDWVLQRRLH